MKQRQSILKSVSEETQSKVVNLYIQNNTMEQISIALIIPKHWVRKILIYKKCQIKSKNCSKWLPTDQEKSEIIRLYTTEKRGIQFLANQFNTHWEKIRDFLLSNNVKLWDKSTLIKSNIEHYGQSKGFGGKKHSIKTKKQMSKSRIGNCNNVTGPKSQFISTIIGKVQGSYELAYLQGLLNRGLTLPSKPVRINTSYGSYFPDFEYPDRFVEVKSPFTWEVCIGKYPNGKGIKTNIQHKKIKWTSKNIKPVEVVILNDKEALKLFLQAIENKKLITEEIIYKNGKYYKVTPLPILNT